MIVISHRGYWKYPNEKNILAAFERSFNLGLGTETDLRDHNGKIVIAHDMPKGNEITFEDLLNIMNGRNLPLALNIKADGLYQDIKTILEKYKHTNYFTFDMSIPDMICHIKNKLKVFTGLSDILTQPVLLSECEGVWLDCFNSDWYDSETIDNLIAQGKKVCIVSADLHKRETLNQWSIIRKSKFLSSDNLMICSDFPESARAYFYEN